MSLSLSFLCNTKEIFLANPTLIRPAPPFKALGIALNLLHLEKPFSDWDAKQLISTVKGSIKRNHYILAQENGQYTGVACWGLCSEDVGMRYVNGEHQPSYQDCLKGDHFLLFIIYAKQTKSLKEIIRFMKHHHPDRKVFGRRFHSDKQELSSKILSQR